MQTHVKKVNEDHPELSIVREAVDVLRGGGLVALPTETVYGLAADARSPSAVQRIFAAKGRPPRNPIIVHAADDISARRAVAEWPEAAGRLAAEFWPGPLTVVLPRAEWVPDIVTAGAANVGIRVPSHPVIQAVLRAADLHLAAPSANRSQSLSPTRAEHVLADLDGQIELVLDAGPSPCGIESTVVALLPTPRVLRPGPITQDMLERVLQQPCPLSNSAPVPEAALPSPGLLERHYAPRTQLEWAVNATQRLVELLSDGQRIGWLSLPSDGLVEDLSGVVVVSMPGNATEYARRLYAKLHWLDGLGLDRILVSIPPSTSDWLAIRDRLQRAAGP
jgi:L-threonylcarbamoyladenylate synthase